MRRACAVRTRGRPLAPAESTPRCRLSGDQAAAIELQRDVAGDVDGVSVALRESVAADHGQQLGQCDPERSQASFWRCSHGSSLLGLWDSCAMSTRAGSTRAGQAASIRTASRVSRAGGRFPALRASRLLSAYVPGGTSTVLPSDRPALSVHRATGEEGQAVSAALDGSAAVGTVSVSARAPAGNRSTAASGEPRRTSDMRVIGLPG